MSYVYDFADNKIITPAELNAVAAQLGNNVTVSSHFAENTAYAVSRLNLIRSDIVSRGVLYGMEPSCTNATATVGIGVCIFENGMRLEITEPEVFEIFPGTKNYIYMYASPVCAAAVPVISKVPQTSADFIPIAEISNGTLTDKRIFSQAKIPLKTASRVTQTATVNWSVPRNLGYFTLGAELPLTNTGFAKIFIKNDDVCGIWDRTSGLFSYAYARVTTYTSINGSDEIIVEKTNVGTYKIKFEVSGNVLKIYGDAYSSHSGSGNITGTFNVELI